MQNKDLIRFKNKIKIDEKGCWIWQAQILPVGYGAFWLSSHKRSITAHRASWILHHGEIPDGLWVLHKCDVYSCANPDHLFLGTHKDNMDDMRRKGRQPKQIKKIPDHEEIKVLNLYLSGVGQRKIAKLYNVSQRCIQRVLWERTKKSSLKGEENGNSKLTRLHIKCIRWMRENGNTQAYLAKLFGIHITTVQRILYRESWKSI